MSMPFSAIAATAAGYLVGGFGTAGVDGRSAGEVSEEAHGHLGSAGVVGAEEQDGWLGHVGSEGGVFVQRRVGMTPGRRCDRRRDRGRRRRPRPTVAPTICAAMNGATEIGAIPAKLSENIRPTVTAGLANDVELVNQ